LTYSLLRKDTNPVMEKFRKFSLDETGRQPLITSDSSSTSEPIFRIGGKTDPSRFQSRHSQPYIGFGVHDDERSDRLAPRHLEFFDAQRRLLVERMIGSTEPTPPPTIIVMPTGNSSLRSTLSPVHEIAPISPTDPTTPKATIKIKLVIKTFFLKKSG